MPVRFPAAAAGLALGALRAGLGLLAAARPALVTTPWLTHPDSSGLAARVLGPALGGRDLALGLGAVRAARAGDRAGLAAWSAAGALADAFDVATTVAHWSALPRRGRLAVLAAASGGVLSELAVAAALWAGQPRRTALSIRGGER